MGYSHPPKKHIVPAVQSTPLDPIAALIDRLSDDRQAADRIIIDRLQSGVPLVADVARHLIAAGGKRLRPLLTLACTRLFDADTKRCHGLAAAVEFIHSATLLHDDVVDESQTRRGTPSANAVFGNKASVLVGDFLFARAFELMTEDGSNDVLSLLSRASAIIAEGEVLQLNMIGDCSITWDDYCGMIGAKTAALFAAASAIGAHLGGQPQYADALYAYGYQLGLAFQIADDVLDYTGKATTIGKDPGDDAREGKVTAPLLIALQQANANDREKIAALFARTSDPHDRYAAVFELCRTYDSFEGALIKADAYADAACKALADLPHHPLQVDLLALPRLSVRRNA